VIGSLVGVLIRSPPEKRWSGVGRGGSKKSRNPLCYIILEVFRYPGFSLPPGAMLDVIRKERGRYRRRSAFSVVWCGCPGEFTLVKGMDVW